MTDPPSDLGQTLDPQPSSAEQPWPGVGSPASAPGEAPGSIIGRYKLLQKIGEGGCGVVYMAEQEHPVRRRVALKVIKLGMDTRQVVARFEAERQGVAMMDHPNIARVLDAGATDTGRPYFVMELVRGIRITDYCDQNHLSTSDRLALFMQVCNALQHAHQKGIIHRDIKPSNILVTLHDGTPVPKVIDFGIAKATDQRLTDKTLFTAFEQFIGTPAYMSPEQAEMSGLDIDTRTDIYSLGVLLYELLTGRTPFDPKELQAAGLDGMRRTIREREPARPSTRLSTMLDTELTTVANHRRIEPARLTVLISGDLDWIVMKALEKDRTRRYESASALAADIQRHLGNEPVIARPPTTLYKFHKLVRRNKAIVTAAAVVSISLIVGMAVSTSLFFKERAALGRAVAAEQKQLRMRQEAEKLARLYAMYQRLRNLHKLPEAESTLREAVDIEKEMLGGEHWRVAMTLAELADLLGDEAKPDQAEIVLRQAAAIAKNIVSDGHHSTSDSWVVEDFHRFVTGLFSSLGRLLEREKRLPEAETAYRDALALTRQLFDKGSPALLGPLKDLAGVLSDEGKRPEAEQLTRERRDLDDKVTLGNALLPLRKSGCKFTCSKMDDGSLDVGIDDQPFSDLTLLHGELISRLSLMRTQVSDLAPLRGMPLKRLRLADTRVTDLSPLTGMPLESLQISRTTVSDLTPLRGMPLRMLNMTDCAGITNLEPIAGIKTFESVILPPKATGFEFLRGLPNLARLGFAYDATIKGPDHTAAEFWAIQDRKAAP